MILIVDDMDIFREPLAAYLRNAGYETACASDVFEARRVVHSMSVDLILLDISMPGIDGLSFLRELRNNPATADTPVFMLTAVADRDRIRTSGTLRAQEYLLKSRFNCNELLTRIRKYLGEKPQVPPAAAGENVADARPVAKVIAASAEAPPSSAPEGSVGSVVAARRKESLRRAQKAAVTTTFSGVITEVMAVVCSPRGSVVELATLVSRDSALAVRVIASANAAIYGSTGKPCASVTDAVRRIGFNNVRNIAVSTGVFDAMSALHSGSTALLRFWQHSLAVARLCEELERPRGEQRAAEAYLTGLCHGICELLTDAEFQEEHASVDKLHRDTCRDRDELETEILGITHRELLGAVVGLMSLPAAVREPIEIFHRTLSDAAEPGQRVDVLRVAHACANGLLLTAGNDDTVCSFSRAGMRGVASADQTLSIPPAQFISEVRGLTARLANLTQPEDLRKLLPPYAKHEFVVYLIRDLRIAQLDPIDAALSEMCQVRHADRLADRVDRVAPCVIVTLDNSPGSRAAVGLDDAPSSGCPVLWIVGAITHQPNPRFAPPIRMPVPLQIIADHLRPSQSRSGKSAA